MIRIIAKRALRFRSGDSIYSVSASPVVVELPDNVGATEHFKAALASGWIHEAGKAPVVSVANLTDDEILREAHARSLKFIVPEDDALEPSDSEDFVVDLSKVSTEALWEELDMRNAGQTLHGSPLAAIEESERLRREAEAKEIPTAEQIAAATGGKPKPKK
jgi:hypothetical protein